MMEHRSNVIGLVVASVVCLASLGCGDDTSSCSAVTCSGHGQCVARNGELFCRCFDAYTNSDADPLVCLPYPADADADVEDDGAEDDAVELDDAAEAEAGHCGNGVVETELGEECDGESPVDCGSCGTSTVCGHRECRDDCTWSSCPRCEDVCEVCPGSRCYNIYERTTCDGGPDACLQESSCYGLACAGTEGGEQSAPGTECDCIYRMYRFHDCRCP